MAVYAVFLNEPDPKAWKAIEKKWPNRRHFILNANMAFVAPEELTLTADVAQAVGMNDDGKVLGLVFEWASHNGFNGRSFWEWLGKVQA